MDDDSRCWINWEKCPHCSNVKCLQDVSPSACNGCIIFESNRSDVVEDFLVETQGCILVAEDEAGPIIEHLKTLEGILSSEKLVKIINKELKINLTDKDRLSIDSLKWCLSI